jgi:putative zinc finger protein
MTISFRCEEKQRLVAYLYDEIGDADRAAIERHLSTCAPCTDEIESLRAVRLDLGRWQPPDAELGFRIVRETAPAARAWWRPPVWVPTALAAGLVLAAGAALANMHLEVGNGGFTLRAGWSQPPVTTQAAAPAPATASVPVKAGMSEAEVRQALAALEMKLRTEFAASSHQPAVIPASVATNAAPLDRGEVLQQVKTMLDESERRQQRELALGLVRLAQDVDTQRRADLVRFEQGFGQIETLTAQEAARQRNINNYLVRVSQRQGQ